MNKETLHSFTEELILPASDLILFSKLEMSKELPFLTKGFLDSRHREISWTDTLIDSSRSILPIRSANFGLVGVGHVSVYDNRLMVIIDFLEDNLGKIKETKGGSTAGFFLNPLAKVNSQLIRGDEPHTQSEIVSISEFFISFLRLRI